MQSPSKKVELWSVRRKQIITNKIKSFRKGGEGREEKNNVEVRHRVGQLILLEGLKHELNDKQASL